MVLGCVISWYAQIQPQLKMVKVDLTKEELEKIIQMIENSSVQMQFAEQGLKLLKKFKEAKE